MAHRTANQQDTDRPSPPAEGEVEVVTADGTRKPASLPKRMLAGARDMVSMTDEQPDWPAQLTADDQTSTDGNADVTLEQPPQATLVAYRQLQQDNTRRVAEQAIKYDAQMVSWDQHARARVYDIQRLTALVALRNQAAAQLAGDGWANVDPTLISEFQAEVDGWKADRRIG